MKKQLAALLIASLILVSLTACGDRNVENHPGNQSSTTDSMLSGADNQSSTSQDQNNSTSSETDSTSGESPETRNKPLLPVEEVKQILKPLKEYGVFYWKMHPHDIFNKELVDLEQTVTAERHLASGKAISENFYKVVNGDIQTEEQFISKLDSMFTEKMKKEFLENPEKFFEFSDGNLYLSDGGAGGMGLGMDTLYLDSVKYTDENTVAVTVTSFGDKDKWGVSKDIRDSATATLVKTDNGFRVDMCDEDAVTYFYFYNQITYNDETIEL